MPRRGLTGKYLNKRWKVGANPKGCRYRETGDWFMRIKKEHFPGALFDPNGYLLVQTEEQYRSSPYLKIKPGPDYDPRERITVPDGIASVPGYQPKDDPEVNQDV